MKVTAHFESYYHGAPPLCVITLGSSNQFAGRAATPEEALTKAGLLARKSRLLDDSQLNEFIREKLREIA